ncbi:protein translocase subunit secY/sec61 alpha [Staphylothermus marinus F1]|uniref:Protein translocase subunit SecY n=1 Tax=Staphylothermus marinus (strain ATCC 43588 / DSM 3639 / JCM 9404 / F1) TaxID=399550 RepID=A3DND0_STAMF|nr:preprotein translocase subunit SecY [Staphylothermus marinus]ABN70140.1 protein translocase subunit secY/sec61 alpha [Staphylothermus marinus F1]
MGLIDLMAKIADYIPTVEKPKAKPGLYERLLWTAIALIVYVIMANTPLYGISVTGGGQQILLVQIIFASRRGTLMELGIGPIVTAGLIMQILVGAKMINLDMSNPDDRRRFTAAQKTFALILAAFEAAMYVSACRYWTPTGPNPFFQCSATIYQRIGVGLQLFIATYIVILLDEMIQKGWGIGSGVSLFILTGVAQRILWNLISPITISGEAVGFIPYAIQVLSTGGNINSIIIRSGGRDLVGLIVTFVIIFLLVYLEGMKVEIPVTSPRLRSIKTKVPLKFLYVTNIPVLLVGILYSDILVFASLTRLYLQNIVPDWVANMLATYDANGRLTGGLAYYLSPPGSLARTLYDPMQAVIYAVSVLFLATLFGIMWVEISGLSASAQAEELIKSGMEIPGIRRNPKILERILSRYIFPLTVLSSLIVALIAVTADLMGAYGTGTGILLAVGIVQQYYTMIAYERTLEAYPLLKRLVGE